MTIQKDICPETGKPNDCEVARGGVIENCWCWEMPHAAAVPTDENAICLSKEALEKYLS